MVIVRMKSRERMKGNRLSEESTKQKCRRRNRWIGSSMRSDCLENSVRLSAEFHQGY